MLKSIRIFLFFLGMASLGSIAASSSEISWQDACFFADYVVVGTLRVHEDERFVVEDTITTQNYYWHFGVGTIEVEVVLKGEPIDSVATEWCSHWTRFSVDGPFDRIVTTRADGDRAIWIVLGSAEQKRRGAMRRPIKELDAVKLELKEQCGTGNP